MYRKFYISIMILSMAFTAFAETNTPAVVKKTSDILTLDARIDPNAPKLTKEQEEAEAFRKLLMAANSGNIEAQYKLGNKYANGDKFGQNRDPARAVFWWNAAASQGHAAAQCSLAILNFTGEYLPRNEHKAAELWKVAAEGGDVDAQFYIGVCYANGLGVMRDAVLAYQWWNKAALAGNERAQVNLGFCYARGEGVRKDLNEAIKIWTAAAENGNTTAQCKLASCYYTGDGVKVDIKKAVAMWTAAAEKNNAEAMRYLANCYKEGVGGLPKSLDNFKLWIKKAAQAGDTEAIKILEANPAL